ncbi:Hypothetical predicted protein [Podarcis lilfordi]|uniref:Uncharacterized protein n=1 Tax=Podarcis lilfordi TaxID=74358 RepID=A0AA35JPL0_9SAUR|nr:Hypothetical predicted protein [Podarcis lilfordi]
MYSSFLLGGEPIPMAFAMHTLMAMKKLLFSAVLFAASQHPLVYMNRISGMPAVFEPDSIDYEDDPNAKEARAPKPLVVTVDHATNWSRSMVTLQKKNALYIEEGVGSDYLGKDHLTVPAVSSCNHFEACTFE